MSNALLRLAFFLALDGDTPNSLSFASLTLGVVALYSRVRMQRC